MRQTDVGRPRRFRAWLWAQAFPVRAAVIALAFLAIHLLLYPLFRAFGLVHASFWRHVVFVLISAAIWGPLIAWLGKRRRR